MFERFIAGIKELAFPDNCLMCGTFLNSGHQRQICIACLARIKPNVPPFCGLCSRHLNTPTSDGVCGTCRGKERHYDRAWGACIYDDSMRRMLHMYKYGGKTALAQTFTPLMITFIDTYRMPLAEFTHVVPMPLHPARVRERGFNQSALLSQGLCAHYGLTHHPDLLARQTATEPQASLDQKQRWTNLKGAFKINPSFKPADAAVLLVDDLLTTGATADAAAMALKEAGAAYVGVLTLAITDAHTP